MPRVWATALLSVMERLAFSTWTMVPISVVSKLWPEMRLVMG